jgi:hypothetical protein
MEYPTVLWPRDTLSGITINGKPVPDMVLGHKIVLNSEADLIDFLCRSVVTEIEFDSYPILFGLLGGDVTHERLAVWVLPEALIESTESHICANR